MTIKRWVHCLVALNEHNEVVGAIYDYKQTFPFPSKKTPEKATQRVREPTPQLILDHQAHTEKVRKIYRQAQNY